MGKSSFNLSFAACLTGVLLGVIQLSSCRERSEIPQAQSISTSTPDNTDATASAPVPLSADTPVIVAFGDSLTAGVSGRSYPDQLQDLLLSKGYRYRVDNQGVSGETTTDGLERIENVIGEHPALVILEFGGNDGLRGTPVEFSRKNLDEMMTRIQQAKLPLVLLGITLPPNYGPDYVRSFTAMYPSLAKAHHVPLMPFLLLHVYQDGNLMQPDGIHPNQDGNKIVAQDVFNLIKPLLKK